MPYCSFIWWILNNWFCKMISQSFCNSVNIKIRIRIYLQHHWFRGVQTYENVAFSYNPFSFKRRELGLRNKTCHSKEHVIVMESSPEIILLWSRGVAGRLYQNWPWHLYMYCSGPFHLQPNLTNIIQLTRQIWIYDF